MLFPDVLQTGVVSDDFFYWKKNGWGMWKLSPFGLNGNIYKPEKNRFIII